MGDHSLVTFVLGIACTLLLMSLLVWVGPRMIPGQLDKCWVELQRQQPNCSTRIENGVTMIRDSRCIRPQKGLSLVSVEASGWYQVVFAAKAPPQVNTE